MKINELLVEMMLVQSKLNVDIYMKKVEEERTTATEISEYGLVFARQKNLVNSIKDKMYISFANAIFKAAKENDSCIINFIIFHPNMWNEDAANCLMYIERMSTLNPIDIDSRVKIYDGAYPSKIGGFDSSNIERKIEFKFTGFKPSERIETISSQVLNNIKKRFND